MAHRVVWWMLCILALEVVVALVPAAQAGPMDSFERLVMPGRMSKGHAKYEDDCDKCHKPFKKGGQTDLCLDCHKEVAADVRDKKGLHGKLPGIDRRDCKTCHTEHKGRDENIAPFDADSFLHDRSDFPLQGAHQVVACSTCHSPDAKFRKAPSQCKGCHDVDDVHRGRLGEDCTGCHNDMLWGENRYDHDKTDFPLKNAHINVGCADCHANERYKNTPTKCLGCHQQDDVHQGDNGEKCNDCHDEQAWGVVAFDHDKDTKYPLEGRHATVGCQDCHRGDVYKKLQTDCFACHEKNDVHNALFGKKCVSCHTAKAWTAVKFNHNKDTKYALQGKHKKVACTACHKGDVYADLSKVCVACHRHNDVHQGQEGEKCEQCHDEGGWGGNVFFDHDLTKFPLLGTHVITACEECHLTAAYQDADITCRSCHMKDDAKIHKERLGGNCELCHSANAWKLWSFDHDKQTDYRLDGAHKGLDCHACHAKPVKTKIELSDTCISCHERDDIHRGSFGTNCKRCHVTESWKRVKLN